MGKRDWLENLDFASIKQREKKMSSVLAELDVDEMRQHFSAQPCYVFAGGCYGIVAVAHARDERA